MKILKPGNNQKAILFMHFVNAHVGKYITQLIDGKRLKTN